MTRILRITQSTSLVSNSSIKVSCRFSARLHPDQAQDPPVLHLSPGTTTNLVLIFSRLQRYINKSSCHILYSGAWFKKCECDFEVHFQRAAAIFHWLKHCPNFNIRAYCSPQPTFLLLPYLKMSIVRRVFSTIHTMHKNICYYEDIEISNKH